MGWDTEVIIIGEKIENENLAKEIGSRIFEKDSKSYGKESFFIIDEGEYFSIFYTYERRKYLPFWVIEDISFEFQKVNFTLLGSCSDFIGGPPGLIKIFNGKIIDSYGMFKAKGEEEKLRNKFLEDFPLNNKDEDFYKRIIPMEESDDLKNSFFDTNELSTKNWKSIKNE